MQTMVNVSIQVKDAIYLQQQKALLLIFSVDGQRGGMPIIPEGHNLEISVKTGPSKSSPTVIGHVHTLLSHVDNERFRAIPPRKEGEPYEITLKNVSAQKTSKVEIVLRSKNGTKISEVVSPIKQIPA
jgi:hypothetical protein